MQLRGSDERFYGASRLKDLLFPGLIVIIVASSVFGFLAILTQNQQFITAVKTSAQATPDSIIATVTKNAPSLADDLSQNTNNRWSENTHCVFQGGSYHIFLTGPDQNRACLLKTGTFNNFAFQVDLSLISGTSAGLFFRSDGLQFYYYGLKSTNLIFFCVVNVQTSCLLSPRVVPGIPIKQKNTLFVLAENDTFALYMNGIFIDKFRDSTSSGGFLGFDVASDTTTQNANTNFTNFKLYQI